MSKSMSEFFDELSENWDKNEVSSNDERREFLKFLDIKEGNKVLDLACGTGVITSLLQEKSKTDVIGIDISPKMIEKAKEKEKNNSFIHYCVGDFVTYNFNEKFDYIIVFNAYPHFLDRKAFKNQVLSLLNKNGKLAIIHNISRQQIKNHHKGCASQYSRELLSPLEEAQLYLPEMNVLINEENEHSYKLVLQIK
jgi:ubiquinone/menaquinone biosynthesis C-methylase UbiE